MILAVGSLNPNKNLSKLVQAFSSIAHLIPHELVLVGAERSVISGADHVQAAFAAAPKGRFRFAGYISDQALLELYNQAEFFVFPSFCEGFGIPPLEAMRCACPVIASNRTSVPEICGEAALYCDPEDVEDIASKMLLFVENEELRNKFANKGLEVSSAFSLDRGAHETLKAIRSLLD